MRRTFPKSFPTVDKRPVGLKYVDNLVLLLLGKSNKFAVLINYIHKFNAYLKERRSDFIAKTNMLLLLGNMFYVYSENHMMYRERVCGRISGCLINCSYTASYSSTRKKKCKGWW